MELSLNYNPEKKIIEDSLVPGTYFIGDIYALKDEYLEQVLENLEENSLDFSEDDDNSRKIIFDKVFGGPNRYNDCYGHKYLINSEYLGIFPFEMCNLSNDDEDIDVIGQRLEFDEEVNVYIVDGKFMFQWENGFLKIDTKNKDIIEIEDYEYNDVNYEEFVFERYNETNDDNAKNRDIYMLQENAEDYDDVDIIFEDNESKHIDPSLLDIRPLSSFRDE